MAGSRKGERRGGAKPGRQKTGGRTKGVGNKPKKITTALLTLDTRVIHKSRLTLEQERDLYRIAVGDDARLPKEVMLDAMRYFENTAREYLKMLQANMEVELAAIKSGDKIAMASAALGVELAERRVDDYLARAVDVGYKAAPYVHARLSAILVNPGDSDKPLNAIRQLMQDIDEAGGRSRFIEHDAGERVG